MRTAMIAALSCASLCALLLSPSARAYECGSGQAKVRLQYGGPYKDSVRPIEREAYSAIVVGQSTLSLAEASNLQNLNLYVMAGTNAPAVAPYWGQSTQSACLNFHPVDDLSKAVLVPGARGGIAPSVCYSEGQNVHLRLLFKVKTDTTPVADKQSVTVLQVYAMGQDKNGNDVTLFDTRSPCKG